MVTHMRRLACTLLCCLGTGIGWGGMLVDLGHAASSFTTAQLGPLPATTTLVKAGRTQVLMAKKANLFTPDRMQTAIRDFMMRQIPGTFTSVDVEVHLLHPDHSIQLPPGTVRTKVKPVGPPDRLGRRGFKVVILVNGRSVQTVRAMADITVNALVVGSTRLILTNRTIQPGDVALVQTKLRSTKDRYLSDPNKVIGQRAIRPIRAHAPISASVLANPFAVKKGERVTIQVKRGGLLIHTLGVSKSDGQVGQRLAVMNMDSRREIQAVVKAPGIVEVMF